MDPAQRDLQVLSGFVRQSVLLGSLFMLWREGERASGWGPLDTLRNFVAWFLLEGRQQYAAHAVVDRAVIDALTRPDVRGGHVLMRLAAHRFGVSLEGPALNAWYGRVGVPHFKLAPFLGSGELEPVLTDGDDRSRSDIDRMTAPVSDSAAGAESAEVGRSARSGGPLGRGRPKPTVSIVGFHRSILGIGEDARTLFECLRHIGVSPELVDVSPPGLEPLDDLRPYTPFEAMRPTGSVVIFCLPAFEMMGALAKLNLTPSRDRHVIGYWPWETTALPAMWDHVYDHVDEIWASSRFLREVYAPKTAKPVTHVPLHVRVDAARLRPDLRAIFDEAFSFLTVFDFHSGMERKNPEGTIDAFVRAFPKGSERVQLILKTIHGHHRPAALSRIVDRARQDGRIVVIDGAMPRGAICAMLAAADAYVSLHRAEGFGRPIAEAMMLDTPVVATGWSGCADFLTAETGYPVSSTQRAVRSGEYPFAAGSWAEPDVEHAADQMRALFRDPERANRIGRAKAFVEARLAKEPVAAIVAAQLDRLRVALEAGAARPS